MSDKYAVIGNPVVHSKSPLIHAAFAKQTAQDLAYVAIPATDDDFEATVERFGAEGGLGMNVTLPFKHRAFALARERTRRAELAVAANTLSFRENKISADNTDGHGLVQDLKANLGTTIRGRRVLIMGAGGASYGVCAPLLDEAPAVLVVANRSVEKAHALCEHFAQRHSAGDLATASSYSDLAGREFDLIVNATSAGLSGAMPELPRGLFAVGAIAYDMVYGRSTPFLEFAKREGADTADGLGMLVEQAAESFYLWRGVRPATAAVISQLRALQP
jgi:shikimate dehydrogenase